MRTKPKERNSCVKLKMLFAALVFRGQPDLWGPVCYYSRAVFFFFLSMKATENLQKTDKVSKARLNYGWFIASLLVRSASVHVHRQDLTERVANRGGLWLRPHSFSIRHSAAQCPSVAGATLQKNRVSFVFFH